MPKIDQWSEQAKPEMFAKQYNQILSTWSDYCALSLVDQEEEQRDLMDEATACLRQLKRLSNQILGLICKLSDEFDPESTLSRLIEQAKHSDKVFAALLPKHGKLVQSTGIIAKSLGNTDTEPSEDLLDLTSLTIAFYYIAHRLITVINLTKDSPNPKLKVVEIRDIRNNLLEHPELRGSKITLFSIGYWGTTGPIVKPIRRVNMNEQKFMDKGFIHNNNRLLTRLASWLSREIATKTA